jgi:hypothetical protein
MNQNRTEGVVKRGKWGMASKAFVTKAMRLRCSCCAMKSKIVISNHWSNRLSASFFTIKMILALALALDLA